MQTPLEDTNPEAEILYSVNMDTQEVNVVFFRETTEDKKIDVTTESPTTDAEVELNETVNIKIEKPTQTEQLIEDTTEKPVDTTEKTLEELAKDSIETQIEKPEQVEKQVQTEIVPPAKLENPKPLFVEM